MNFIVDLLVLVVCMFQWLLGRKKSVIGRGRGGVQTVTAVTGVCTTQKVFCTAFADKGTSHYVVLASTRILQAASSSLNFGVVTST